MNEERVKVLQLLSEGKITVEEAERLLQALGAKGDAAGPSARDPRAAGDDWGARLAKEIEAQVERATAGIPAVVAEVSRSLAGAFAGWKVAPEHDADYGPEAERDVVVDEPLAAGRRLALHNPRGHVQVATWEQEALQARVHVTVRATSQAAADGYASEVRVDVERSVEGLRLCPVLPPRPAEVKSCRLDFALQVPRRVHLDLRTAHGDLVLPEVEGDAALANQHGQTRLGGATGRVTVEQAHGPANLGPVGGDLQLEGSHGAVEVDRVEGTARLRVSHGPVSLGWAGGNAEVGLSHGRLEFRGAGQDARVSLSHSPADIGQVGGDLSLEASHGPVHIHAVGGRVRATNHHAPLNIVDVGRDLVARNHHGPVAIEKVGGQAVVEVHHGPVSLRQVAEDASVDSAFGPVHVEEVAGRVVVSSDRGPVRVEAPASEVVVRSQRANVAVHPTAPVRCAYTLQSERGNVELVLPAESSVEVHGRVTRGRLETSTSLEVTANSQGGQDFRGRLGQGEGQVKVEVDRGNVYLMAL